MVEQITFQMIFQFLQTVGILVGVFYYVMTIRANQRNQQLQLETRQAQLFQGMFQLLNSENSMREGWELLLDWEFDGFEDFWAKYGPDNRDDFILINRYLSHYEGLGIYIKHGYISPEIVDDFISGQIVSMWEKYQPVIYGWRKHRGKPVAWEHFEYLYNHIKPIYVKQHGNMDK